VIVLGGPNASRHSVSEIHATGGAQHPGLQLREQATAPARLDRDLERAVPED
jgi:hypothetical protein